MANELLIYTQKTTPRVSYIFKHIFIRILNIPIKFTSIVEEFVAHDDLKMSYGKSPLGNEFFIQSHGLLFEQEINDVEINISQWDSSPCFFGTGKKSNLPFDISNLIVLSALSIPRQSHLIPASLTICNTSVLLTVSILE